MTDQDAMDLTPGKPTQRTIADATGLAITTVSKALANDPRISLLTRDRVKAVARELGYVPDRAAQRLRTGRTNVISLVLDPHSEIFGFGSSMIDGISEVLRPTPYNLTIMQYQLGEDPLAPIEFIVRNRQADGILFARTEPDDSRVRFLRDAGFPFITHGRTDYADHAWYDYDNSAFAERAVDLLADQGVHRIGLVPPATKFTYHRFMMAGFRAATARRGCTAVIAPGFDLNEEPNLLYQKLRSWMSGPDAPEGIICPGEVSAMTAHAVNSDLAATGIAPIPLVAKQSSEVFDHVRPLPLRIPEDVRSAGVQMAQSLVRLIKGAPPSSEQFLVQPPL